MPFFISTDGDFQISANIYKYYYFLETVITSYEPTFWGIGVDGEKKFYSEKRSEDTIELLKRIHQEILVYTDRMLELMPDISMAVGSIELYDRLLGYFSADYSELKTEEMNQLINIDEFMGKKWRNSIVRMREKNCILKVRKGHGYIDETDRIVMV